METITLLGITTVLGFTVGLKAALLGSPKKKPKRSTTSKKTTSPLPTESSLEEDDKEVKKLDTMPDKVAEAQPAVSKEPDKEEVAEVQPAVSKEPDQNEVAETQPAISKEPDKEEVAEVQLVVSKKEEALPDEVAEVQPIVSKEPIIPSYDIFIRHHNFNRPEVETLARNLTKVGYRVFLDRWEMSSKPGFEKEHDTAWQESHHIILVATPETIESGWAREEYESLSRYQQNEPNFHFIPVIFTESSSNPLFLPEIEPINFNTKTYFSAFKRLMTNLGDKSYQKNDLELPPKSDIPLIYPQSNINAFIHDLLAQFAQNCPPPLIVLAQQDRSQIPMVNTLLTLAKKHYQPARCLHIALPYGSRNDTQDYFANLGKQCQFSEIISNDIEFEQALRLQLENPKPLFLLISHFENGPQSLQEQLVGICRSLNETYANQAHIVLCGGEQLRTFKYQQSSHSLLNIAQEYRWPELERVDVYAMRDIGYQTLELNDEIADKFLELSGGHPILLQKCLHLYQDEPTRPWQDYPTALSLDPFVWQLFTPFKQNPSEAQQTREWLAQIDIAPSLSLFSYGHKRNELLRRLYWKNLLVEKLVNRNRRIQWRCEALRLAGQEILR
jgi:hypothetical protein